MSPQQSLHMLSGHGRTSRNQTYKRSACYSLHSNARQCLNIESYYGRWFAPPDSQLANWLNRHRPKQIGSIAGSLSAGFRSAGFVPPNRSSVQKWPPGIGCEPVCQAPPDKPPGYSLLVNRSKDPPDINSTTLNKYKLRNCSLLPKSRERSIRQGGRMGDNYRRYKTCH